MVVVSPLNGTSTNKGEPMQENEGGRSWRVLFLCDMNRMRSPTAEKVFSQNPKWDVKSAGVDKEADVVVSRELLEWADFIFVMEKRQKNKLLKKFRYVCRKKPIVCLGIPDHFEYMDPYLIKLLKVKVMGNLHGGTFSR